MAERKRIMESCHNHPTSGHFGVNKTTSRITDRFMWPGVTKDIAKMVCY